MTLTRLGPENYTDMPWKNGGGVTRELLRLPHPSRPEAFLARLSIATVAQSGPFSAFPGIDRTIMLLDGAGMALAVGGAPEVIIGQTWQPFAFSGDAVTECRLLAGAVRDFNLMVARDTASAEFEVVTLANGQSRAVAGGDVVLAYGLAGALVLQGETLEPETTLWGEVSGDVTLTGEGVAVLIRLHRR